MYRSDVWTLVTSIHWKWCSRAVRTRQAAVGAPFPGKSRQASLDSSLTAVSNVLLRNRAGKQTVHRFGARQASQTPLATGLWRPFDQGVLTTTLTNSNTSHLPNHVCLLGGLTWVHLPRLRSDTLSSGLRAEPHQLPQRHLRNQPDTRPPPRGRRGPRLFGSSPEGRQAAERLRHCAFRSKLLRVSHATHK